MFIFLCSLEVPGCTFLLQAKSIFNTHPPGRLSRWSRKEACSLLRIWKGQIWSILTQTSWGLKPTLSTLLMASLTCCPLLFHLRREPSALQPPTHTPVPRRCQLNPLNQWICVRASTKVKAGAGHVPRAELTQTWCINFIINTYGGDKDTD